MITDERFMELAEVMKDRMRAAFDMPPGSDGSYEQGGPAQIRLMFSGQDVPVDAVFDRTKASAAVLIADVMRLEMCPHEAAESVAASLLQMLLLGLLMGRELERGDSEPVSEMWKDPRK